MIACCSLAGVSTHSRLKAAGSGVIDNSKGCLSFNTQPPEGGWKPDKKPDGNPDGFNTQPPEGGWIFWTICNSQIICFNTQPPEGGWQAKYLEDTDRQ